MDGREFELYLRDVFQCAGYTAVVTPQSCDEGVDLIVTGRDGRRWAVQAKCHRHPVGITAIQETYTGISCHECDAGVVIAAAGFTRSAKKAAQKTGVLLWTPAELRQMLNGQ